MRCQLARDYRFESARRLTGIPDDHPCARLHGHSFQLTVTIEGEVDPATGWVMDFAAIDAVVVPVVARLDHQVLNEIVGLDNPTSEHIAQWIWQETHSGLPGMVEIAISETQASRCIYRGPQS